LLPRATTSTPPRSMNGTRQCPARLTTFPQWAIAFPSSPITADQGHCPTSDFTSTGGQQARRLSQQAPCCRRLDAPLRVGGGWIQRGRAIAGTGMRRPSAPPWSVLRSGQWGIWPIALGLCYGLRSWFFFWPFRILKKLTSTTHF
jgi:hypothetical protein